MYLLPGHGFSALQSSEHNRSVKYRFTAITIHLFVRRADSSRRMACLRLTEPI